MKNMNMLAIDLGASSGRGIVGSFNGETLSLRENHRFSNDPVMSRGAFRWDILRILHEIKLSIREATLSGERPLCMGIDTWGVDYGLLDKHGELLANPYHYRDLRTSGLPETIEEQLPAKWLYEQTGIQQLDFNTVYQLAAQKRDNPELLASAEQMLLIPDLLNYFLTGVRANEYTVTSTGALVDAKSGRVSKEIFQKLGIRPLIGELAQPGDYLAAFDKGTREELGVSIDVHHVASHDTASAVLSVPSVEKDFVYISSGTWSLMGTELDAPMINEQTRLANFTNEGGVNETIRFLKNIMGLWIIQECRRQWKREGKEYSFAQLQALAEAEPAFACFIDPDDALFATPGNMPARVVEYCKKTGQKAPETVGQIVRTVMESLAFRYRATMESIERLTGKKTGRINIVGGGTKDTFLCALTADACGVPVVAGPVEATSIGNLCTQLLGKGELANVAQARELVRRSFETTSYAPVQSREAIDAGYASFYKLLSQS